MVIFHSYVSLLEYKSPNSSTRLQPWHEGRDCQRHVEGRVVFGAGFMDEAARTVQNISSRRENRRGNPGFWPRKRHFPVNVPLKTNAMTRMIRWVNVYIIWYIGIHWSIYQSNGHWCILSGNQPPNIPQIVSRDWMLWLSLPHISWHTSNKATCFVVKH